MSMENKETDSAGGGQDRLTGLLRLWASRFTKPVERLSVNRLAALIEAYLSKEERDRGKAARQAGPRWDHDVIEGIITQGSTVLDLGCGNGELLERLIRARGVKGQGIEIDPEHVSECVARGVCVFQTDLDEGLQGFPDNFFDFIILEKTLQTVHQPVKVLSEMLRVGKKGIVSFPNFAYWRIRLELGLGGKMPIIDSIPFPWHETPNIHLCSLEDFIAWAGKSNVSIIEGHVLAEGKVRPLRDDDNLFAEEALLVVQGGG